jgi:tetratricopeptide (TPR) repeat protein
MVMRVSPIVALAVALGGCAHTQRKPTAETTVHMDPVVFVAGKGGEVDIHDPAALFEAGSRAYQQNQYEDALGYFDRVISEHPSTQHARSSLYNAGLCLEQLDRRLDAVARFKKLAEDYPESTEALDALYRLGSNLVALKDWAASDELHQRILKMKNLTLSDQVEAYARLGEARFERGRYEEAERTLRQLRELYRQHEQEERLDTDYFLAMGVFYLAEIPHAQYKLLPVRLPQKQLESDLEAKARLLLLAQQRYVDTIRVKHPEWATAAGFRIGSLYREFYDDLVGAPIPPQLQGEAREVYQDQVKKKVRALLFKAVAFHEKNVLMAERTGEKNDWVKRSNAQLEDLRKLLEPGITTTQAPDTPAPEPPRPIAPTREPGGRTTL